MTLGLWNILASVLVVANLHVVTGHAYITEPPGRNAVPEGSGQTGGCPHCGNGDGICGDGNQWPKGSDFFSTVQNPHRTYTAGEVVKFEISMNVNHKGHHDFFICDRPISSDTSADVACLQQWPVMRATREELGLTCAPNDPREDCQPIDVNYPGRWYHYPGMSKHSISYRIPAGLQCEACTLQWFWPTANSKAYDEKSYSCYQNQLRAAGWNVFDFCGWACSANKCPDPYVIDTSRPRSPELAAGSGFEEFRNCADIKVLPGSGGGSTRVPRRRRAPVTTPRRRQAPATPRRRRAPEPEPNTQPATGPLPCSGGGPTGSCKNLCQAKCNMRLTTNQCWGTPRYIECKCSDGSTHSFPGCDCENGQCPQGGVTSPEPEPEPEPTASTPRRRRAPVASPRRREAAQTGGCTGEPCTDTSPCRSEWGYCGSSAGHCNAKSTWSSGCAGGGSSSNPEPEPEPESTGSTPEPEPEPEPTAPTPEPTAVPRRRRAPAQSGGGSCKYQCTPTYSSMGRWCSSSTVFCRMCGGQWCASLAQAKVGEVGVHQHVAQTHSQRFLGSIGASMMSLFSERDDSDQFLSETSGPQTEL